MSIPKQVSFTKFELSFQDMMEQFVFLQISKREEELEKLTRRIETVEKSLRLRELTPEERTEFDKEMDGLKQILKSNEEELKKLRGENLRTGIVASALIFISFLVYGVYHMFWK